MARDKLFAGHAVRRLRRRTGLTQAAMAEMLAISPSYLNLIERNQRALPAALLVAMAERFDFDPRGLGGGDPGGGAEAIRRRLADPLFADLAIDRHEVEEWLAAAPGGAEAFARAFDRIGGGGASGGGEDDDPMLLARREIDRWRNHFADLDAMAEALADELRLSGADLYGALVERLRVRHGLSIRILPVEVLPDLLRRLDLHARQLQLSERLAPAERIFALAHQLGQVEARTEIDALARGAGFADRTAERLFRQHLLGYFAGAVMMPYARFLRACEASGYDLLILERRFGASFDQVARRLTTMQRVGARGLPFFLIRIDRAGQVAERLAGASGAVLVEAAGRCPLWRLHHAFDRPGTTGVQLVELEDGARWITLTRSTPAPGAPTVGPEAVPAEYAIGLGVAAAQAASLHAARGLDPAGAATPIGLGCRACLRADCPQRSAPPAGRARIVQDRERGLSPYRFAEG
ncbi:putative transcriptional regulator/DNA-binding XRE family transcriptional regulator [Sphingomonas sp. SORGH_AS802]|uniref:helix-turn-helix domain-containing protein n=1 Tax=unclassified Sphingomonas TaxID=196159 RepID=UPI002854D9CB|nr:MULTISPECIES: short-chain fatty acyl-CoA regulator family protein [unclassified Sphingomonas]MDR6128853.1 putative transcriptional regulator/DNA-binding XRE family transcriptional regulator [Sphingomonas sp. SORGH_AS_0438]MDR6136134.1 putative transcriptional regulator/DNA-binding XRE family transcriptional regulator [Sphingomonas sp. SORGH_AS_0802]